MFKSLYKKCLDLAAHKSSKYYLAIVSFIESSFFPIPPDVMVIPMVISKKNEFIKISGLTIPKTTSIAVTIERKIKTPHIFWTLDLNFINPLNISSLCSCCPIIYTK